tara:strand:+ start:12863 stop:14356 length:1494 start_codon:yes stop_codon:yes gene_type:complete
MSKSKFSFESENLVVDWIGFNIQGFVGKKQIKQIAEYIFLNFGFKSTLTVGLDGQQEFLFNESKAKYQVSFRVYSYSEIYWDGLKIDFSGPNGHQFYRLIRDNLVNWKRLSNEKDIRLSRLDLCYPCKKPNDKTNFKSFLERCYQKVHKNKAIKNFSLKRNSLSSILKIGKRGSPNHFRVYENHTEIRFELEQRGLKLKAVQNFIFEGQIQNFEQIMVDMFFKYSKKVLIVDENYTSWLIDFYRRQNSTNHPLVTGYFYQENINVELININEKKTFFKFLQFIAFSRIQKANTEFFWNQPYSIVQFKITDFMDFVRIKNKNQYQREQLIQFFNKLQTLKPFLNIVTDNEFQSYVIFPVVRSKKSHGSWVVEIAILQKVYLYSYRFFLPTYFLTYQRDFELQIKLHFIQNYGSQSLKKTFYVHKIMECYKSANNHQKARTKRLIKVSLQQALAYKMIQNYCEVEFIKPARKSKLMKINQLSPLIIGQSSTIKFYELLF